MFTVCNQYRYGRGEDHYQASDGNEVDDDDILPLYLHNEKKLRIIKNI